MSIFCKCELAKGKNVLGLESRLSLRLLKRKASHYLSKKWLKEPFDLGYPICSDEIIKDRAQLRQILFPENRESQSAEPFFLYIHPRPKYKSGFELFKSQLCLGLKSKKYWESLSSSEKEIFTSKGILQHLFMESQRIWEGYEIVEYLKRYLDKYRTNPYPLLGLYPWEIITDKLRRKSPIYDFEKDYYDTLITEAFGRNSQRKALSIFYADLRHDFPDEKFTFARVQQLMLLLPLEQKQYYQHKERMRYLHSQKVRERPRKSQNIFLEFVKHFLRKKNYSGDFPGPRDPQLRAAAREWNSIPLREKLSYKNKDSIPSNCRLYKENLLDWKVDKVMDYIFNVGGVVGLNTSFEWKKDRFERTHGYRYLQRGYVYALPYLLYGKIYLDK